jgi:hypothetical protein
MTPGTRSTHTLFDPCVTMRDIGSTEDSIKIDQAWAEAEADATATPFASMPDATDAARAARRLHRLSAAEQSRRATRLLPHWSPTAAFRSLYT